jgi:hypothetical protein
VALFHQHANCFHFYFFIFLFLLITALDSVDSIRVQARLIGIPCDTKEPKDPYFLFFLFSYSYYINKEKDTSESGLDRAEHLAKATNRGVNLALAPFFVFFLNLFLKSPEKSAP